MNERKTDRQINRQREVARTQADRSIYFSSRYSFSVSSEGRGRGLDFRRGREDEATRSGEGRRWSATWDDNDGETTCGGVPRTNFNFLRVRESLSSRGAVLTTCLEREAGRRWWGDADETEKFRPSRCIHTRDAFYTVSHQLGRSLKKRLLFSIESHRRGTKISYRS